MKKGPTTSDNSNDTITQMSSGELRSDLGWLAFCQKGLWDRTLLILLPGALLIAIFLPSLGIPASYSLVQVPIVVAVIVLLPLYLSLSLIRYRLLRKYPLFRNYNIHSIQTLRRAVFGASVSRQDAEQLATILSLIEREPTSVKEVTTNKTSLNSGKGIRLIVLLIIFSMCMFYYALTSVRPDIERLPEWLEISAISMLVVVSVSYMASLFSKQSSSE